MNAKECADCKAAEADAKIAELEQAVAGAKAESEAEVKNLHIQLRYQRRINGILQAMPVDPLGGVLSAMLTRGK